jgi:hypothetical protein
VVEEEEVEDDEWKEEGAPPSCIRIAKYKYQPKVAESKI